MRELLIGGLAFISSFLGCIQVINLAGNHRIRARITSCCIAICQLSIYREAAEVEGMAGYIAYVIGGLSGMELSMIAKNRIKPELRKEKQQP